MAINREAHSFETDNDLEKFIHPEIKHMAYFVI